MQQLYANHMHILISWRKHTQSFKSVRGVALTTNTHCLYIQGEKWLSLQCLKSDKNWSNNYVQSICTSSYHEENTCKVSKQLVQNCKRSYAHNKYPLSIYSGWKMTKFTMPKKWQKLIQQLCPIHMHILIPWGKHMQSFKNNWYKTVRGVALTRDTHCLYNQGEKWLSWQCRKSDKNWSNNYVQSTCTPSYHEENTCKVSKQLVQNCKRSCAHKRYPLSI